MKIEHRKTLQNVIKTTDNFPLKVISSAWKDKSVLATVKLESGENVDIDFHVGGYFTLPNASFFRDVKDFSIQVLKDYKELLKLRAEINKKVSAPIGTLPARPVKKLSLSVTRSEISYWIVRGYQVDILQSDGSLFSRQGVSDLEAELFYSKNIQNRNNCSTKGQIIMTKEITLKDIPAKIKEIRIEIAEKDKLIHEQEISKKTFLQIVENIKLASQALVYFDSEHKNDKQREIVYRQSLEIDTEYLKACQEIESIKSAVYHLEVDKAELSIEIEFLKNTIRVSEIEANQRLGI
jgi:hypothetical protein